ncbi:hypothetical protein LR61_10960 [Morganella morganii]|nr:hypothetical protein LR61_10960 [Morganella morganii]
MMLSAGKIDRVLLIYLKITIRICCFLYTLLLCILFFILFLFYFHPDYLIVNQRYFLFLLRK